jgi:hypothetical protein
VNLNDQELWVDPSLRHFPGGVVAVRLCLRQMWMLKPTYTMATKYSAESNLQRPVLATQTNERDKKNTVKWDSGGRSIRIPDQQADGPGARSGLSGGPSCSLIGPPG